MEDVAQRPRSSTRAARRPRRYVLGPLRIVMVYGVIGVCWILFSDRLVEALVDDPHLEHQIQTAKGFVYVVATAVLLWALMRRHLAERRVLDQEVRAVLDGMADAVLVVDRAGDVVDLNHAAITLVGARSRHELLLPVDELAERLQLRHPDGRAIAAGETASRRALEDDATTGYEALLRRLDGAELLVSVTSAPLRHGGGDAALAVTVIRDITEVKRFEETREEFLATAAHEFKTPLAVIKAYAQLMQKRGQGDPGVLEIIGRQTDRLTRMVQQILEVSRFRVGGAELRRDRFELGPLLEEVAAEVRGQFESRRILVAPPVSAEVVADRDRIARVTASLLENAVRFSPAGGDVEVALSRAGPEAVVTVRDHGLGIAADRQARVFERFYRAHAGTPHDYGGLGLGLGTSREIVTRHGGRMWFESTPGQGSTFCFSLPLAAEDAA